jgi:Xaa-Pro dipeptidase
MLANEIGALLLASPENICYLAGLDHYGYFATTLLIVPRDGPLRIVARQMERPTLAAQAPHCQHIAYADGQDPADAAARALGQAVSAPATVGAELSSMYLPASVWSALQRALPSLAWSDSSPLLASQRAVKSTAEIGHVRAAAAASDQAMRAGIAAARPGVAERDIAAVIYRELIRAGTDAPAFPPFVRASEAIPLEHAGWRPDRILRRGDTVLFELGASVRRYHAPTSRIIYIGQGPAGIEASAEVVLAGLEAARAALRPGVPAGDVYAAWQHAIHTGLGRPGYRRHHCGYLTGLGFPPTWMTGGSDLAGLRPGNTFTVREGMVFHLMSWLLGQELPDYGVSGTAVVTGTGCELLTATPRAPTVVPV